MVFFIILYVVLSILMIILPAFNVNHYKSDEEQRLEDEEQIEWLKKYQEEKKNK